MTKEDAMKIIDDECEHIKQHLTEKGKPEEFYIELGNILIAFNMANRALQQEPCEDMGEVSDGYHTFNQLYHQRAVLFATIVNLNKDKAWKSFRHSDGNYCFDSNGDWFIVGVDTPKGSYTYHYSKEYWDMFDCKELECGKEWDGHTEEDVTRLLSLESDLKTGHWILQPSNKDQGERDFIWWECSECGQVIYSATEKDRRDYHAFCGRCGARMDKPQESEET